MPKSNLKLDADKLETQKQWDKDPCGAVTVSEVPFGTLDFYRQIRKHRYEVYAPWMMDVMPFKKTKGKEVLEIGVGLGSDHYNFAVANNMTMLDLSKTHLNCTSQHMELEGLKSTPTYGDAENMPFKDSTFDLVYSFGVLHHTPNIEKSIAEVHRVLKPGGEAWIGLYHKYSWFFAIRIFLIKGILKAGFLRNGWKKTLSLIEYREDNDSATPLVNVYSQGECYDLFKEFKSVEITTHHAFPTHFFIPNSFVYKFIPQETFEKWFAFGGWYLVVHCTK